MKLPKYTQQFLYEFFFICLGIALLVRLFLYSIPAASDFEVYWHAIHAWIEGKSPYGHYSNEYVGLVFKYPPWILPLFLPFAKFDLSTSKWIWTIAQVVSIFYCMRWLIIQNTCRRVVILVTFLFWYIWFAHTFFGQFTIFMLVCGLWAYNPNLGQNWQLREFKPTRLAFFVFLLTSKVFSLVSLLGCLRELLRVSTLRIGAFIFIFAHLILLVTFPQISIRTSPQVILTLYSEWISAASAGGAELGATIVRGQQNHGFTAAILRALSVDSTKVHYDILWSFLLACLFSGLWGYFARKLPRDHQWAGWLSIGVIAHPLAWHHSFVMAYPLCVFALNEALNVRRKTLIFGATFGIICIGILVPQVIGVDLVRPLELIANKSWGVIISAFVLILADEQKNRSQKLLY